MTSTPWLKTSNLSKLLTLSSRDLQAIQENPDINPKLHALSVKHISSESRTLETLDRRVSDKGYAHVAAGIKANLGFVLFRLSL